MRKIFVLISVLFCFTSCLDSDETVYEGSYEDFVHNTEADEIAYLTLYSRYAYLEANAKDSTYLYIETITQGDGDKIGTTDSVLYCVKGTFLRSDTVWYTNYKEREGYESLRFPQNGYYDDNVEAVKRALNKMRVGGKSRITTLSRYAFGDSYNTNGVPQYCTTIWELEVLGATSDTSWRLGKRYEKSLEAKVKKKLNEAGGFVDFVDTEPYPTLAPEKQQDTMSYYIYNYGDLSKKPAEGDIVQVAYKGFYENGMIFDADTVEYLNFRLDKGGVIDGFNLSVARLGKGGRLISIIPPKLAYENAKDSIPDHTPIMFDITLVNVAKDNTKSIRLTKTSKIFKSVRR